MTAEHVEIELKFASRVVTVVRRGEKIEKQPVEHHAVDFDFAYFVLEQIAAGTDLQVD